MKSLSETQLKALAADLIANGRCVIAPARVGTTPNDYVAYRKIKNEDEIVFTGELPRLSLKEFYFPPTETLLKWKQNKSEVKLETPESKFEPTVILGARPCDAAAIEILDKLMGWDYRDELWFGRREATTVVTLACDGVDKSCFCHAVGVGPNSKRGADVIMAPVSGGYVVEAITPKGNTLIDANKKHFTDADSKKEEEAKKIGANAQNKVKENLKVDLPQIKKWLEDHFEDKYWSSLSLKCHGCGICASVCPTCHCFDIVDEPNDMNSGVRRRNWDTCQSRYFTLHGSGHNPRPKQTERMRQRVMHKFAIYPKRFDETLCTGCGRCSRHCPVGMDLAEILTTLGGME